MLLVVWTSVLLVLPATVEVLNAAVELDSLLALLVDSSMLGGVVAIAMVAVPAR